MTNGQWYNFLLYGDNMKRKYKVLLLVIFSLWLISFVSASYAFFMVNKSQDGFNVASSECFKLTFSDKNNISLESSIPISEDEARDLTPYEFTIKNVCKKAAQYDVNIEKMKSSTMSDDFIRYKLDEFDSQLLSAQDNSYLLVNDDAISAKTIESAILLPDEEITYNLRMWLDENSTIEAANKTYESKVVVNASMKKNPYVNVSFEANGGVLDVNNMDFVEGRLFKKLPIPQKKGYVFLGWYKSEELLDEDGVGNDTIVDPSINKLYAKYFNNTFMLSIDPNGGEYNNSPAIYETNVTYGDTYELSSVSKEGYTFKNWVVKNGNGTSVNNNIVTMGNEDSLVQANYSINSYNLTINPNGGIFDGSTNNKSYSMEYNSVKNISNPIREGYTFTGWTVSSGNLSGNTFTIGSSDAILSANWQINDYKWIVYHNKMNVNGDGYTLAESESGHGNYGTSFSGTLKNYTGFTNPSKSSKTIGEDVKYNQSGTPTNNVLNYNYSRNKYSLTVNPNGGVYNSSTNNTVYNDIYYQATKQIDNPTKTGYNFSGWSKSGTNTTMSGKVLTMGSSNSTLTANWSAKTYTVTLNNQSATTAGTTSLTATYDSNLPKITIPKRTEYIFEGYYTSTNGYYDTKYINADGTSARKWDLDHNTTLYAKWKNEYTNINFDFYGSGNAFQHLGYSLSEKSSNVQTIYNVKKNGSVVNSISIPSTYTYNNQKYRITKTGGSIVVLLKGIEDLKTVTLPSTVTEIGSYSFVDFESMTSFNIPSTVKTIGDNAFSGSALTTISIPSSITSIGQSAFSTCSSLKTVYVNPTNITFGKGCFSNLASGETYQSTIYVRNSSIRNTLMSNQTKDSNIFPTTSTDYYTVSKAELYGHMIYYTQVSTNYNW